jgi:hypothetical protein
MLWPDVPERLQRAPAFLGGMGQCLAEKQARDLGWAEITGALLERWRPGEKKVRGRTVLGMRAGPFSWMQRAGFSG